jgi:hypothetical protein
MRIALTIAAAFLTVLPVTNAAAADLGVVPDAVVRPPPLPSAGVMFVPTTSAWPQRYRQTGIVQQPAPGISVYEYDSLTSTAPPVILVVPPAGR